MRQIHNRIQVQDTKELHLILTRQERGTERKENEKQARQWNNKMLTGGTQNTHKTKDNKQDRNNEQRRQYSQHFKEEYRRREKCTKPKCNSAGKLHAQQDNGATRKLNKTQGNYKKRLTTTTCDHYGYTETAENQTKGTGTRYYTKSGTFALYDTGEFCDGRNGSKKTFTCQRRK